jgi:hypothetical protein
MIIGYKTRSPWTSPFISDVNVAGPIAPPRDEFTRFVCVVVASALPVVALPPVVLCTTPALPVVAFDWRVLLIAASVEVFVDVLVFAGADETGFVDPAVAGDDVVA